MALLGLIASYDRREASRIVASVAARFPSGRRASSCGGSPIIHEQMELFWTQWVDLRGPFRWTSGEWALLYPSTQACTLYPVPCTLYPAALT